MGHTTRRHVVYAPSLLPETSDDAIDYPASKCASGTGGGSDRLSMGGLMIDHYCLRISSYLLFDNCVAVHEASNRLAY